MLQLSQHTKATMVRAGLSGGISGAASSFLLGESGTVSVGGIGVPACLAVGLCSAGGSLVADAAHTYVLPHLPMNERYINMESAALGVCASGGATMAAAHFLGSDSYMQAFALGAVSFLGADYLTPKLVDNNPNASLF